MKITYNPDNHQTDILFDSENGVLLEEHLSENISVRTDPWNRFHSITIHNSEQPNVAPLSFKTYAEFDMHRHKQLTIISRAFVWAIIFGVLTALAYFNPSVQWLTPVFACVAALNTFTGMFHSGAAHGVTDFENILEKVNRTPE